MSAQIEIRKVLVILGPDAITPDEAIRSPLLRRAASLAQQTNCELELFHVCYDGAYDSNLFATSIDIDRLREQLADQQATRVAEIAARLADDGLNVTSDVCWDYPRTDAILRKIARTQPDVVLKTSREHSFLLGVRTHTDWDLARRSPADVWFVHENVEGIRHIAVAIGNTVDDTEDVVSPIDYELVEAGRRIATEYGADLHAVNAYQVPDKWVFAAAIGGNAVPVQSVEERQHLIEQAASRHRAAVDRVAMKLGIDKERVHIHEGRPDKVISSVASGIDADLIVLGARSIGRLERFLQTVTVEPVLAEADCDIFVKRDADNAGVPDIEKVPVRGTPECDLSQALTYPQDTFESPQDVVRLSGVSIELRQRILQAWEYDIRAVMAEENEGGRVREIDTAALSKIRSARARLRDESRKGGRDRRRASSRRA